MTEQQSLIRPLFNYTYKNEGVILDQKYNYQGNILAVCNSLGDIIFYSANGQEQTRQIIYFHDRKKVNEPRHAVLNISWSMPIFSLFAVSTINRDIEMYTCHKNTISLSCTTRLKYVPQALAFCPIQSQPLLAVGLSNGSIILFDDSLHQLAQVDAHEGCVSCLAWDHKILSYEKNKWIGSNFASFRKFVQTDDMPELISGSIDTFIKIWKCENHKLIGISKWKAHHKAVRDVQWKHTYLVDIQKYIISCSQDGWVKIWKVKINQNKITSVVEQEAKSFGGPVYRANFNFLGNVIAISYCNEAEQKVETFIMRQKNGVMMGEQLKLHS